MLTLERLKQLLRYDEDTGQFTWLVTRTSRAPKGTRAGTVRPNGYTKIYIDGKGYYAHRLAWFYVHGVWPKAEIDHINGNPADNRLLNLREATRSQNQANGCQDRDNKGVTFHRGRRKGWQARIMKNYKYISLGYFETVDEARLAYSAGSLKYFGEFGRAQ